MHAITDLPQARATDHACSGCDVRSVSICNALESNELDELEHLAEIRRYPARATLFSEGERADHVFTLRRGMVRLCRVLCDGRRQILGFVLPGDFLGVALQDRRDFTAEAVCETEACRFERSAFLAYVDRKAHLLRALHGATEKELALGREQLVLVGRLTAEEKVAAFLLNLRQQYRRVTSCDATLPLPMSRQDIGDYCGLTLETVSRMISKLAREKIILIVPDGVRIVMLDRLKSLVS